MSELSDIAEQAVDQWQRALRALAGVLTLCKDAEAEAASAPLLGVVFPPFVSVSDICAAISKEMA